MTPSSAASGRLSPAARRAHRRAARERFRRYFDAAQVYEFVAQLITVAALVEDPAERPKVTQDPDDDYLVALAAVAEADALVSGDHHLTDLKRVGDVRIMTPREFLNELADSDT